MYKDIVLKCGKEFSYYTNAVLVQGDTNAYRIILDTPWELEGYVFKVTCRRSDDVIVTDTGEVQGNAAMYVMANSMYSVPGDVTFQLTLCGGDETVLTPCELSAYVAKGNGEGTIAENTVPILDKLISRVTNIEDEITNIEDEIPSNLKNGSGADSVQSQSSQALSEGSAAIGTNCKAGSMAFSIIEYDDDGKAYTLDSTEGLEVGDVYSLKLNWDYDNVGKITSINENKVTVDTYKANTSNSSNLFRIGAKPNCGTVTYSTNCIAVGNGTKASGVNSYAEGKGSEASGYLTHAEGNSTKALSAYSHAEGDRSEASGSYAHAEGCATIASGQGAHSEGLETKASGLLSHAEGHATTASGTKTHAEGYQSKASGDYSHAEGQNNTAEGQSSHAEGADGTATGSYSHTEGYRNEASKEASHAEGRETHSTGYYAHSEGYATQATGNASHAEGTGAIASGTASHAEGSGSRARGNYAHAEGGSYAEGSYAHAEGRSAAYGDESHAEGQGVAYYSHAHAEGSSKACNHDAHAEGTNTQANGFGSHAEGRETVVNGDFSHAEGIYTIASGTRQHVQGKYNIEDTENQYAHIVGNGNESGRSNCHTLDWNGNAWFSGNVEANGIILKSTTPGSTARYMITVSDSGNLTISFYDGTPAEVEAPDIDKNEIED